MCYIIYYIYIIDNTNLHDIAVGPAAKLVYNAYRVVYYILEESYLKLIL